MDQNTDKAKKLESSYDENPYISKTYYHTQPEKLKSNLRLLDFISPDLKNAKVLEIGCSFGGNIIPFAIENPDATVVGVDLSKVQVDEGNKIIAVASSGFHSNGYSLVRKVFTDYNEKISLKEYGENVTMGDVLLTPTKIYVKPILKVLEKFNVNGMAHITGGGLYENLPRCMGKDLSPVVFREKVRVPEIFKLIAERSKIKEENKDGKS